MTVDNRPAPPFIPRPEETGTPSGSPSSSLGSRVAELQSYGIEVDLPAGIDGGYYDPYLGGAMTGVAAGLSSGVGDFNTALKNESVKNLEQSQKNNKQAEIIHHETNQSDKRSSDRSNDIRQKLTHDGEKFQNLMNRDSAGPKSAGSLAQSPARAETVALQGRGLAPNLAASSPLTLPANHSNHSLSFKEHEGGHGRDQKSEVASSVKANLGGSAELRPSDPGAFTRGRSSSEEQQKKTVVDNPKETENLSPANSTNSHTGSNPLAATEKESVLPGARQQGSTSDGKVANAQPNSSERSATPSLSSQSENVKVSPEALSTATPTPMPVMSDSIHSKAERFSAPESVNSSSSEGSSASSSTVQAATPQSVRPRQNPGESIEEVEEFTALDGRQSLAEDVPGQENLTESEPFIHDLLAQIKDQKASFERASRANPEGASKVVSAMLSDNKEMLKGIAEKRAIRSEAPVAEVNPADEKSMEKFMEVLQQRDQAFMGMFVEALSALPERIGEQVALHFGRKPKGFEVLANRNRRSAFQSNEMYKERHQVVARENEKYNYLSSGKDVQPTSVNPQEQARLALNDRPTTIKKNRNDGLDLLKKFKAENEREA